MDSRSRLDYALFQLTPTRTRCDLIICAGDCKEKLASGLLEPFVSHLKFAKDEVSKGGYSITLSAPASSSWFTKSTLERFVRFVSTPDVLERFITIEKEIVNIDCSLNINASSDSQSIYSFSLDEHSHKHEDITRDSHHEEDPKLHLQRALETRKALLQREQAMVYARALVAGFETDFLQDLICFADAFGSPRLREACLNFIELCNTKSNDSVWMDEVAAMQAYSRSQFSYNEDDPGQDLRIKIQNGNFATNTQNGSIDGVSNGSHLPQYMHSYHGGPMFHLPYQGLPFPYYQGNLLCPPNAEDSRSRRKRSHNKQSKVSSSHDASFDSSDSSSGDDSSSYKRSSSQNVVIKNMNYINPARDEESEHGYESSEANQNLDRTVEEKQQWDIFQNLLMKDADDKDSEEHVSHKFEEPDIILSEKQPEVTKISSISAKQEEKDWYSRSLQATEVQEKSRDIFEDHSEMVESKKDVIVEYPLTNQARSLNECSDSRLSTHDSLMASESNLTAKRVEAACVNEPSDLHLVLERDIAGQQAVPAWSPEMESGNGNCKIVEMDSSEVNKSKTKDLVEKGLVKKSSTIEAKPKDLAGSRMKKPTGSKTTVVLKGRSEKEEEKRKKVEELLTQRQKRIAERSASSVKTAKNNKPIAQQTTKNDKPKAQQTAKKVKPKAQQTTKNDKPKAQETAKNDKPKAQQTTKNDEPKAEETTKKKVIRSSTIDRLSAARVITPKVLPTESKPRNNKPMKPLTKKNGEPKPAFKPTKVTSKDNGVSRSLLSQKAAGEENKRVKTDKPVDKNINGLKKNIGDDNKHKQLPKTSTGNSVVDHTNINNVSETLQKASLVLQREISTLSDSHDGSSHKGKHTVSFKVSEDFNAVKKKATAKVNYEVPVAEISTPLQAKESAERSKIKKKWSSLETSSKALSGFKKLLSFGRRS